MQQREVGPVEVPATGEDSRLLLIAGRRYSPRGRSSPMPGPLKRGPPSSACRSSSAVSSNDGPAGRGTIAVTGRPNRLIRPIRARPLRSPFGEGRDNDLVEASLAHRLARWLRMALGHQQALGPGPPAARIGGWEGGVIERPIGRLAIGDIGTSSANSHGPACARCLTASNRRGVAAVRFATTSTRVLCRGSISTSSIARSVSPGLPDRPISR